MIQIRSIHRLDQIEMGLRSAAARHRGSILATSRLRDDALSFTLCLPDLYSPLLEADNRFAAFLPSRVAVCVHGGATLLETIAPREFCRLIHRPDLEPLTMALEDALREILQEVAQPMAQSAAAQSAHCPTEDQINMRAALPQRIDCHGTKVEELAGVGAHDSQGG